MWSVREESCYLESKLSFKIVADDLRRALKEIEAAEAHGFMFCEAIFEPREVAGAFVKLEYSDLCEKAHPTDKQLNWGRFQGVVRRNKFENGKLVAVGK